MKTRRSRIHDRLSQGQPLWCFKSNIPVPMIVELIGSRGVDCLWLDMEHFATSTESMANLLLACRAADTDSLVRIPNGEYGLAAKMLDNGADAIMYPQCRDAGDIEQLMAAVRYAPAGRRGIDTGPYHSGYGAMNAAEVVASRAGHDTMVIQIETLEALDNLDRILDVPGIDALFIGPGDLSVQLQVACSPHQPEIAAIIARVAAAAKARSIPWGMPAFGLDHFAELIAMGAQFVSCGSDSTLLGQQVNQLKARIEPLLQG